MSTKIPVLDQLDRGIVHALSVAPRASWKAIGAVIGVSDQTVARRFRAMQECAGLRVLGVIAAPAVGWRDWILRLQTRPGSATALAEALARRADTRWVHLVSGGTEIVCVLQERSPEERDNILLRGLPGSRQVVSMAAHSILHVFGSTGWDELHHVLSPEQIAGLPQPPEVARGGSDPADITSDDVLILDHLAHDGRASVAALASATNWHESTVRRRIEELWRTGVLYFDIDIRSNVYGVGNESMLWLRTDPSLMHAAGEAIAQQPEVPFVAATTGPTSLIVSVLCRNTHHLYEFLSDRLRTIPGIREVESVPIIGTLKTAGALHPPAVAGAIPGAAGPRPSVAGAVPGPSVGAVSHAPLEGAG